MKRPIKYPIEQVYDGNAYPKYAPGHLFEVKSKTSLCGSLKETMSAPVFEKEYGQLESWVYFELNKTCKKCYTILINLSRL